MGVGEVEPLKRWLIRFGVAGVALFLLLNVLAYRHARSFFFYSSGPDRTPAPELLSWRQKAIIALQGIKVPKPSAHATPSDVGLNYEEIALPGRQQFTLAGWRIPRMPATSVTLLFHGYNSEKSGLLPEAKQFHELGHEVVMIDFPGHGDSAGNQTTLGFREAEDVAATLAWARAQWPDRKIFLYGHSMGGAAVMRAMAELSARPDAAIVESVFDTLLEAIRFRFRLLSVPSFPAAEILLFWGGLQLGVDGYDHDVTRYAAEIDVPVLIVHGGRDHRASVAGARSVYEQLRSDRKEFVVINDAGHVNPCVTDPQDWSDRVGNFLR